MLQAGGMQLLTDGLRVPDESNPRGYFEYEAVKRGSSDLSWLAQAGGKTVKIIHLLLLQLPADRDYRVIFMLRDIQEVINSQRVMLQRQGKPVTALTDSALAGVFNQQLDKVRDWLAKQSNFRTLYVNHRDVIIQPLATATQINRFLGGKLLVDRMASIVDPALYRQRKQAPAG
jgi:hypothetical protein